MKEIRCGYCGKKFPIGSAHECLARDGETVSSAEAMYADEEYENWEHIPSNPLEGLSDDILGLSRRESAPAGSGAPSPGHPHRGDAGDSL